MRNGSVDRLLAQIESGDEARGFSALESLWRWPWSARRLQGAQKRQVVRRLGRVLRSHPSSRVRAHTAYVLGVVDAGRGAQDPRQLLLEALLGDLDPAVRGHAAEALGSLSQHRKSTPFLDRVGTAVAEGLRGDDAEVRFWCLYAVGVMNRGEHRQAVTRLVDDPAPIRGLWSVGQEAADVLQVLDRGVWPDRDPSRA